MGNKFKKSIFVIIIYPILEKVGFKRALKFILCHIINVFSKSFLNGNFIAIILSIFISMIKIIFIIIMRIKISKKAIISLNRFKMTIIQWRFMKSKLLHFFRYFQKLEVLELIFYQF